MLDQVGQRRGCQPGGTASMCRVRRVYQRRRLEVPNTNRLAFRLDTTSDDLLVVVDEITPSDHCGHNGQSNLTCTVKANPTVIPSIQSPILMFSVRHFVENHAFNGYIAAPHPSQPEAPFHFNIGQTSHLVANIKTKILYQSILSRKADLTTPPW